MAFASYSFFSWMAIFHAFMAKLEKKNWLTLFGAVYGKKLSETFFKETFLVEKNFEEQFVWWPKNLVFYCLGWVTWHFIDTFHCVCCKGLIQQGSYIIILFISYDMVFWHKKSTESPRLRLKRPWTIKKDKLWVPFQSLLLLSSPHFFCLSKLKCIFWGVLWKIALVEKRKGESFCLTQKNSLVSIGICSKVHRLLLLLVVSYNHFSYKSIR